MEILCVYSIYIYIVGCISTVAYHLGATTQRSHRFSSQLSSSCISLQEQFVTRKGFALSSDAPGELQEASGLFKSALSKARCRGIPTNLRILGGLIMKHRVNRVSHGLSIKHDGSKILKWDEMGANIAYNANMLIEYMLETAFIWTPKSVHSRRSQGRLWGIWYFADGIKCHHTSQAAYTYIYICICRISSLIHWVFICRMSSLIHWVFICRISSLIHWVFQNVK